MQAVKAILLSCILISIGWISAKIEFIADLEFQQLKTLISIEQKIDKKKDGYRPEWDSKNWTPLINDGGNRG